MHKRIRNIKICYTCVYMWKHLFRKHKKLTQSESEDNGKNCDMKAQPQLLEGMWVVSEQFLLWNFVINS